MAELLTYIVIVICYCVVLAEASRWNERRESRNI